MSFEKEDYAIVMRSFWPVSPVVGEGMMQVSETLSLNASCRVITQDQSGLSKSLNIFGRGKAVKFSPIYAFSNSSSNVFVRSFDLVWFALATFAVLVLRRPKIVYVATDPPILVPIMVAFYSKFFGAKYVYHVQDIHPEATGIVYPRLKISFFRYFYNLLLWSDDFVVRNAAKVITLTHQMAKSLSERGEGNSLSINYLNNPAAPLPPLPISLEYDFSFVGNAGRLQRMPLVILAIKQYLSGGGKKRFAFAGAGVMSRELRQLSKDFPDNVVYFGKIPVDDATKLTMASEWAMLPIDDEVCHYAFPSKASTYALSGKKILAICSKDTSVAQWVRENELGVVIHPELSDLIDFFKIEDFSKNENYNFSVESNPLGRKVLSYKLSTEQFVNGVLQILEDCFANYSEGK